MRVKREDILYWDGKTWRTLESRVTSVDDEAMVFDEEEAPNWDGMLPPALTERIWKEKGFVGSMAWCEATIARLDALEAAVKRLWVMDKDIIDLYTGKGGK